MAAGQCQHWRASPRSLETIRQLLPRQNAGMSQSSFVRAQLNGSLATQPTHMETAVTRLLISTRELLEALTDWSLMKMTELDVSNQYVKLGNDFNDAVTAFAAFGISMECVGSSCADTSRV